MDYLGKLLLAIDRARPWNGFAILSPGTTEYAISPMPVFWGNCAEPIRMHPIATYRW